MEEQGTLFRASQEQQVLIFRGKRPASRGASGFDVFAYNNHRRCVHRSGRRQRFIGMGAGCEAGSDAYINRAWKMSSYVGWFWVFLLLVQKAIHRLLEDVVSLL